MNILMTTMSLDIGGAETHIIELCKELKRRDCDAEITVASNGGVYVDELEKHGIKHIKLPLHTKRLFSVIKSYTALKKLLKNGNYDVVHAHARIPAFICGMLCKKLKIKFVTTAHGVYKITPYWRILSNWGERALAVSYDVKQYLINQYKMASDNITVTINGIDVNNFSNSVDSTNIVSEFNLNKSPSSHRIGWAARIDNESAHIAFQLVEATPMLFALYEDLEIVITGNGTAYTELKQQVDNVNRLLGKKVVIMTGARTDINKFMASCDIFIGVSRSVLEAMSAERPVILSGSQGYLGIFNDDKLKPALDTNFCCRGYKMSTVKELSADIINLFSMSDFEKAAMGKYNRSIVIDRYSIIRMANDAVSVYRKMAPFEHFKHGDIIMSGYFGFGNMGDDSLLQQIINRIKLLDNDVKITVLSKTPKTTSRIYGVNSINRFNLISIHNAMRHAKLLINGGGNLLQNKTSKRSLIYYIHIMKLAKKYGLKLMLYASGIGPVYGEKYVEMTKDILNEADVITLREELSLTEIKKMGVTSPQISLTCDPVFHLECADENWVKYVMYREGLSMNKKYFMFSPRAIKDKFIHLPDNFDDILADACYQTARKYKLQPVIIPLQPKTDYDICKKIADQSGGIVISGLSAAELAGLTKHMEFVAGLRLHLLIYAISAATPVIAIDCDPKIKGLFELIESPYIIDVEKFTAAKFVDMAGALMNNSSKVRTEFEQRVQSFCKLSENDAKYVIELLGDEGREGTRF
jgi:polysaccharide pyruvyl transferase CsaB